MIKINGKTVKIDTQNTTYIFNINSTGQAETLYYGSIIPDIEDLCPLTEKLGTGYGSSVNYTEGSPLSLNNICCECSTIGKGDFREPFAVIADYRGNVVGDFVYQSMRLIDNFTIPDLPNSYGKSETLETVYTDKAKGLSLSLYYSTFTDCDVIIKSASITNLGDNAVTIERLMSSQLDLPYKDYIMDTLDGTWAKERYINSRRITDGVFFVDSKVGASSSNHNPYVVIKKTDCSLNYGDAYGLNLVYSGNHMELAEVSFTGKTRILNGIN
ncbi:MAG: glycoside hydrolase family 36 N-terminal domain-containing protein, partial [Clostridia bacterium]